MIRKKRLWKNPEKDLPYIGQKVKIKTARGLIKEAMYAEIMNGVSYGFVSDGNTYYNIQGWVPILRE